MPWHGATRRNFMLGKWKSEKGKQRIGGKRKWDLNSRIGRALVRLESLVSFDLAICSEVLLGLVFAVDLSPLYDRRRRCLRLDGSAEFK